MTADRDTDVGARPTFSDFLAEHRGGLLDAELGAKLREIAESVRLQGKSGKLTLHLTLNEESDGLTVTHEVAVRKPKTLTSTFYYLDDDAGTLTTRNPLQPQLDYSHNINEPAEEAPK